MADVAKLLVAPVLLGIGSSTYYTVPASTTAIVRNIHINNVANTAYTFTMALSGSASTAANQIYSQMNVAPYSAFDWSGFLVLPAGATIQALASVAVALNLSISGVESS